MRGSEPLGSTAQPPEVEPGQGGCVMDESEAEYDDRATPDGVRVAQRDFRVLKSGEIGLGAP